MQSSKVSLDDKYLLDKGRAYLSGIEALVRLPILQHQRDQQRGLNTACFISGYRGSPLGALDQSLWKAKPFLEKHHIHFQPGINEDLGMTSVWGSQQVNLFPGANYDGVYGMWYGKGPGLDRSMDVLKHANAFGTSKYGGVLAVVGDDHACKSSTLPHQSDHMFIGATCPVLNPAGVQEILDLGVYGWELSRYSGCWVGMKVITENCDAAISAEIDPSRVKIVFPDDYILPEEGVHARWPDTPLAQEERLQRHKIYAALAFARANHLNRITLDSPNARLGIVTTGKSYLDTLQAMDDLGIDETLAAKIGLRLFKIGMSWPLEPVMTHQFADGLEEILVVEEKRSVIEDQLTTHLYNWPVERRPRVVGEYDEDRNLLVTNLGELTPALIARVIAGRIGKFFNSEHIEKRLAFLEAKERSLSEKKILLERSPWYCSGCPHNTSTVVPEGSMAMAGIGCHYMVQWMDRDTYTFTQMGGEGATWIGQAPFTKNKHVFQNLGDGTYFHSGLLAIRAAIAAGVNITYKILYNDAVAMTGGQPVDGELSVEQMIYQLRGEGVKRIAVVSDDPDQFQHNRNGKRWPAFEGLSLHSRDNLDLVQRELREVAGTTALIYVQACAAEKRRRRKKGGMEDPPKRVFINQQVCEGCGDCGVKSNCLSVIPVETALGRKRAIDQSACNKDFSCIKGFCPSFVTVHGGQLRRKEVSPDGGDSIELPLPNIPELREPYNILVAGIGGTGVLTLGSILGMAAHIAQRGTYVLTQTGLAQKFGSVTSHVRIAKNQMDIHGARIPDGDAHLLLGADLVVSSSNESLAKVNREFSFAVINCHESSTAEFLRNPDSVFPAEEMMMAIEKEAGPERTKSLDTITLAQALLGDTMSANILLLGYTWQLGLIPLPLEAIRDAISLNAVDVEVNHRAFTWGRRYAVDPKQVDAIAGISAPAQAAVTPQMKFSGLGDLGEALLADVISYRYNFLSEYQNKAYANRYLSLVKKVRQREQLILGQAETSKELQLTHAVAKNYFKLLAIKDEYEVARLYTNGVFEQQLQAVFEGDYRLQFHLAPPLLAKRDPVTGHLKKRAFGPWVLPVFWLLAKLKFLRETALDPFGYSKERKMERQLLYEYEQTVADVLDGLHNHNYEIAIEVLSLPEKIRGFGHIKEQNCIDAKRREEQLMAAFRMKPIPTSDSQHGHDADAVNATEAS